MVNRKIFLSTMSILSALVLMGGAAFAFFSNSGTSSDNVFASGSLDLKLDDNDQSFTDNVGLSINATNLAPGGSFTDSISLHNGGTIAIAEVELAANQTSNSNNADGSNLADVLDLTVVTGANSTCTTGATDHTAAIALALGDNVAPLTLTEVVNADYDALPGLGSDYWMCLTSTMRSTAGNEYQGDSITADFIFTANQDVSQ